MKRAPRPRLRGKPVFTYNFQGLKRTKWEEPVLAPGKHTIEFDFRYDGLGAATLAYNSVSGVGRGGTGTLKVDGKVVATQKMEHTLPLTKPLDTVVNIGDAGGRRGLQDSVPVHRQNRETHNRARSPEAHARRPEETPRGGGKAGREQVTAEGSRISHRRLPSRRRWSGTASRSRNTSACQILGLSVARKQTGGECRCARRWTIRTNRCRSASLARSTN